MPKLTISISQTVLENAHKLAESQGESISSLVEKHLNGLVHDRKDDKIKILRELRGSVKLPSDYTSDKEILQDVKIAKFIKRPG